MNRTLGIFVSTDRHFAHLAGLIRAASRQQVRVMVFLTNRGVSFTRYPGFPELAGLADISLCEVSYQAMGWDKAGQVPGLAPRMFTNQARHRDLIDRCDRYISL